MEEREVSASLSDDGSAEKKRTFRSERTLFKVAVFFPRSGYRRA